VAVVALRGEARSRLDQWGVERSSIVPVP